MSKRYQAEAILHRSNLEVVKAEERLRTLETDFSPGGTTNTNRIIRYSQTGLFQKYPVTVAGLVQCFADTVDNDTIDIPVCTLSAPGGAWVINAVDFRIYGRSGTSTTGGTVLDGDWALSNRYIVFNDITLIGTNFEEYATFYHCTVSFTSLKVYEATGSDNVMIGATTCLIQSTLANAGFHTSRVQGNGAGMDIDSGIFTSCWFVNISGGVRSLLPASTVFMACKFYGLWNITTAAGAGNYVELYKCHFANVSIANAGGALFNDTTWDTITNRSNIDISEGDRSVYDITGHATSHASDIAAGVLLRHLPAPSLGGNIAIDSGAAWVSQPITGDATLAANGALTVTGIGGVPSSAFWLLAGRAGGQIGYGGTGAGDDAYIRSTSHGTKGFVLLADDGGNVGVRKSNPSIYAALDAGGYILSETDSSALGCGFIGILHEDSDSGPYLSLRKSRGTQAAPTIVSDGDYIGQYAFLGYDGANWQNVAFIRINVDGTPGANDMPARITFWTSPDGSATPVERMRISNSGGVRIGPNTTTPQLSVWSSAGNRLDISVGASGTVVFDAVGAGQLFTFNDNLLVSDTAPGLCLYETDVAADNRRWDIIANGETLFFRAVDDAYGVSIAYMVVDRTSTAIDLVQIISPFTKFASLSASVNAVLYGGVNYGTQLAMGVIANAGEWIDSGQPSDIFIRANNAGSKFYLGDETGRPYLTMSGSGQIGINTGAPSTSTPFHVVYLEGLGLPALEAGTMAVFESEFDAGNWGNISLITGTTGQANIYFGDHDAQKRGIISYDNSTDKFSITAQVDITLSNSVVIGAGTAATDYAITFDGETNDGIITWMEDEDYFKFGDDIHFGDGTDYLNISDTLGAITWGGTHKKKLAMRPAFVAGKLTGAGAPTSVTLGAYGGYSFPIWNSGDNVNKELYWRLDVPGRWDGSTDITYYLVVAIASAETSGDDFRFQLSWSSTTGTTGVINSTTVDVTADGDCSVGHTAQYSVFRLSFTIDVSAGPIAPVAVADVLAARIRRVASGGTEIDGEVIVIDHWLDFTIDKAYKNI